MFTVAEILKTLKAAKIIGAKSPTQVIKGISTDSRTIKPGELFIPLQGKNFDGRKFIPEALKKNALALQVKDGLKALQTLAAYHRKKFKIPIIGVTGSCGKTTTKDMIASIFSCKFPTLKNMENLNNEIGVPLTLLKLKKQHRTAVIEMAMQHLGEIKELANIARPNIAVITNIGEAHLEFLKSKKNIAKAKAEIFTFLRKGDYAVINQDDEYFEHLLSKVRCPRSHVKTFGLTEKADVTTKDLKGIKLPLPGEHNIYNALAAIAVARILEVEKKFIKKGLERFKPSAHRMRIIQLPNNITLIDDTYNANPQSMRAALRTLKEMRVNGQRTIAVVGDMLELGGKARLLHQQVFKYAQDLGVDKIFAFGRLWPKSFKNKNTLIKKLKKFIKPHDIILVKGSRGMKMEEIVAAVVELADTYV